MGNALRFLCCGKPSADSESLGTRGLSATTVGVSGHAHDLSNFQITSRELIGDLGPVSLPEGIKFELQTLPVYAKAVGDGDGMTVYVSTADPRESSYVPSDVQKAAKERSKALDVGNKRVARKRQDQIVKAGYRVINFQNEEILARKYRIRLRGIDAPECEMPYGPEAKEELTKIVRGKCLRILVYGEDRYGRLVGDVYCNDIVVQKVMLTNGMAWHYANYDKRPELAKWEKAARAKRIGLWADPNPRKPWEWRKERRGGR